MYQQFVDHSEGGTTNYNLADNDLNLPRDFYDNSSLSENDGCKTKECMTLSKSSTQT